MKALQRLRELLLLGREKRLKERRNKLSKITPEALLEGEQITI